MLPLFVYIPLSASFLILLTARTRTAWADIWAVIVSLGLCVMALFSFGTEASYAMGGWLPPVGINLVMDGLSWLMLMTVALVSFLAVVYSISYMEQYTAKEKYYALFFFMLSGINGVVLAGDIFNLFVFLEIASIASYALVGFAGDARHMEASFKYLILGTVASLFILLGVGGIYAVTGSVNMAQVNEHLRIAGVQPLVFFSTALFLAGFGLKSALIPFHAWLPDAHSSAPAPISAMLSGVLIKAIGVYALARVFFNVIGMSPLVQNILLVLATVSMIGGVLLALGQWDFKRLLAYHSISQVGYIMLGIAIATPLGIMGGLFHLVNHAVFKSLLFFNAGAIEYSTGIRDLDRMGGLKEKMPVTGATSMIASLSIAGVPPFNGFWSKLIIIMAAIESGHPFLAVLAVAGSILTLASFMKVQKYAFFSASEKLREDVREVPFFMRFAMIVMAVCCCLFGALIIPQIREAVLSSAAGILTQGLSYNAGLLP